MKTRRPLLGSIFITAVVLIVQVLSPAKTFAQPEEIGPSGYISVNDINYYYEIHEESDQSAEASGQEEPLLLLHGGLGSIDMFESILPMLAENRQVIGVDLHGHGRTALSDRPVSYLDMSDDLAIVLEELGYDQVDVMGYSMGGGVAIRLAIQHPEIVGQLVAVSAGFATDGFYPEIVQQQKQVNAEAAEAMKETPMYQSYKEIAPKPEEFPKLLDRMSELMQKPYNWSEEIKKLDMPVMLVYGDSDMFRPEHIVEFYQLLGGGLKDAGWQREHMSQNRLAILPNLTHYEIFMAPQLAETVLPFLNGEYGVPSWSEQVQQSQN